MNLSDQSIAAVTCLAEFKTGSLFDRVKRARRNAAQKSVLYSFVEMRFKHEKQDKPDASVCLDLRLLDIVLAVCETPVLTKENTPLVEMVLSFYATFSISAADKLATVTEEVPAGAPGVSVIIGKGRAADDHSTCLVLSEATARGLRTLKERANLLGNDIFVDSQNRGSLLGEEWDRAVSIAIALALLLNQTEDQVAGLLRDLEAAA
jgi:hypothetical protein